MDRLIKENNWSDGVYGGKHTERKSYRKITDEQIEKAKDLMTEIAKKIQRKSSHLV